LNNLWEVVRTPGKNSGQELRARTPKVSKVLKRQATAEVGNIDSGIHGTLGIIPLRENRE
jgi:hypothetical protein